jgi:hypothetical protein
MSLIVQPERVVLWVCTNSELHEGERIILKAGEDVVKHFVTALVYTTGGKEYTYLLPPVDFTLTLLARVTRTNPGGIVGIGDRMCAECRGFEDPGFYRRKFRKVRWK